MILLDTHALLWWALQPEKLSPRAAELCRQMELDGGFASAISIWELGVKVENGKLELGIGLDAFVKRLQDSTAVEFVPVDAEIWLRTVSLQWDHRDPADRVIVATALEKGLPVLTRDALLHDWGGVRCEW